MRPLPDEPVEVSKTQYRFGGASWTDTGTILLTENDRDTRTTRTWVLNEQWGEARKLWDRKQQDSYSDPGSPVFRPGRQTILQVGDSIYLNGLGASPDGDRPFLDRLSLRTFATERLFRSDTTQLRVDCWFAGRGRPTRADAQGDENTSAKLFRP